MKSKLGFHVDIQGHQGEVEKMIRADTRVIKVISSMGMLRDLHVELGDKTVFIARDWKVTDDFLRFGGARDPIEAARRWLDGMRPSIVQAPYAYWESFNEMSNWSSMSQYGDFEAERQRLMAAEGFRACIGNFATGTPAISNAADDTTRVDHWSGFYPALAAAHQFKNVLGLHEYGGLWMDLWYGPNQSAELRSGRRVPFPEDRLEGWLFGRYRKVWRRHIEPNGWTDIRIALTEFGLDMAGTSDTTPLAGYTVGSWTTCGPAWKRLDNRGDTEQYYVDQLLWADRQMQKDSYMLGATIFTWGTIGTLWRDFEIEGYVADTLVSHIQSTQDDDGPLEPIEPLLPLDTPSIFVVTTATDGLWLRHGAGTNFPTIRLVTTADKLGVLELEEAARSKIGKQSQWLRVRTPENETGFVAAWLVKEFVEPPVDPPVNEMVVVTPIFATDIFLRSGAGNQFQTIEPLFMGDRLEMVLPTASTVASIGQAGKWLNVRSPRNRTGWIEAWKVQRTTVGPHIEEPPVIEEERLLVRTTASTGLFVRKGPGIQYESVASVFPSDRLEVLGTASVARTVLGERGQWIRVKTPSGVIGWAGAFYLEEMPRFYEWPQGHALVGLHGPTDPGDWPWDESAFLAVRNAKIQAVKLLAAGDIGARVVNRLRQENVSFLMARLLVKFEIKKSPQQFVNETIDAARRLYDLGIRYFEVHNEPNLHTSDAPEGFKVAWQDGAEFGKFYLDTVKLLRPLLSEASFGFPGLSPGPDEPGVRGSSDVFLTQAESAIRQADFVCMHTYWGKDGSTYLDSIGKVRTFCERFPGQLILVTEFSNPATSVGKDLKGQQYAQFYSEGAKLPSNLGALFSFVLSSNAGFASETWKGSQIVDRVGRRPLA